ncbi:phage portal protein [Litorimonas haliclonae]|uniref:phage portal protein n=1 Tax=Litorimonas haliclonae TaxID=2081977 RepID=UPI0039EEB598
MLNFFKPAAGRSGFFAAPKPLPPESKAAQPLIALQLSSGAHWTPRNFSALCREGFARNPIVYRCVRLIAEAAASVPLKVEGNKTASEFLTRSPLMSSSTETLEAFYGYLQLSGEAYLEARMRDGVPSFLSALNPVAVTPLQTQTGAVAAWDIDTAGGDSRRLRHDLASGRSPLLSMCLFSPQDSVSPLQAAAQAVDLHNEGGRWAKALLENSARPSGALIYKGASGSEHLTEDQFERLKSELDTGHAGARHAGRPLVLEGGLDWKSMSLSPTDMDFIQARREAAREIALAFGVPPMLLGLPGDNTYANYREANQAFWRQTIIPLVRKTSDGLQSWLRPWFDEALTISPDLEKVPALSEDRNTLWQRLTAATFLSDADKRALAGLSPEGGAV